MPENFYLVPVTLTFVVAGALCFAVGFAFAREAFFTKVKALAHLTTEVAQKDGEAGKAAKAETDQQRLAILLRNERNIGKLEAFKDIVKLFV